MSVACVKSTPDKQSLFLKNSRNKSKFMTCFASNFQVISRHGSYYTTLQKNTHPKSLHLPQLNFKINKSILAAAKVIRILSRNVYASK